MKTNFDSTFIRVLRNAVGCLAALALMGIAEAADPASPSDLLEKGIYSQETRGDLDSAIGLYQEVIAKAKDSEALAAQAQYRLGVCYHKKRDFVKASAAFEKLRNDYPEQKDLIALTQEYLSTAVVLQPAPWKDGELVRLDLKLAGGYRLGLATYSASSGEMNGRKIWRVGSRLFAGVQQFSAVEVEADSFKPLHSRWKHTLLGDVDAVYSPGKAELKFKGKKEAKTIDLDSVVYDNEEAVQLLRRLPLATNYSTTINIMTTLGGGATIPLKIEVAGIENLEVPAGKFECYRVELSVKQTFWFSTDEHHYPVKFEAGGALGELASVEQLTPGAAVIGRTATGLSFTAPSGWLFDNAEPDETKGASKTIILDPEATASSWVTAKPLEDLKPEERTSLRAYADAQLKEGHKTLKDLKLREDSWKETTLAGQPAISLVADFVETRVKQTSCAVFAFIGTNAVEVCTYAPAEDFEAFKPKFQAVIDSAKTNP